MPNVNVKRQDNAPQAIYLKDYQAPAFSIHEIYLTVDIYDAYTRVTGTMAIQKNAHGNGENTLVLHGEELSLLGLRLDGVKLESHQFTYENNLLTITNVPDQFTLETVVDIKPHLNLQLSGLYRSNQLYCTQCEAEGFRRITFYQDRPDNLALFTTKITADKNKCPVLLANGNCIEKGDLEDNRHFVVWQDPFYKPSYLFALVAGDLQCIEDNFTTQSKKKIKLAFYVESQNVHKCQFAIDSLKRAMRWDEQQYGREYDLDIYMVVAVNDFNMGAMENKGLNIFNAKYVLADENSATDSDFESIESVIGHEYFHNWSGNRITCRDWFQLSLKEGLTVFREQQFSAAQGSAEVKRIQDVKLIRARQFSEDSGPLVHPVQPKSYIEINNFYTMTIYYKGAEVVRMLHSLLGEDKYRKGMDYYFSQFDGQAVTIHEFIHSFEVANNIDLSQFTLWYDQAGTPLVKVLSEFDDTNKTFIMHFEQSCSDTPECEQKKPFVIPIRFALYTQNGQPIELVNADVKQIDHKQYIILDTTQKSIHFKNINEKPIPSLFGHFSAPVKCEYNYTPEELACLIHADKDGFNQWDAASRLISDVILTLYANPEGRPNAGIPAVLIQAIKNTLEKSESNPALAAQIISLPTFAYLAECIDTVDVERLLKAHQFVEQGIISVCQEALKECYLMANDQDQGDFSGQSIGFRALKNMCLAYLIKRGVPDAQKWVEHQYVHAANMSDTMGALTAINQSNSNLRDELLDAFYKKWSHDPLIVNKWLSLYATCELPTSLEQIKRISAHDAFDMNNPNKVYALYNAFAASNPRVFHNDDGAGYQLIAEKTLLIDKNNAQVASRLCEHLTHWKKLCDPNKTKMKEALKQVHSCDRLSQDVYELVSKSLSTT